MMLASGLAFVQVTWRRHLVRCARFRVWEDDKLGVYVLLDNSGRKWITTHLLVVDQAYACDGACEWVGREG